MFDGQDFGTGHTESESERTKSGSRPRGIIEKITVEKSDLKNSSKLQERSPAVPTAPQNV
jgi:hypothetical protein